MLKLIGRSHYVGAPKSRYFSELVIKDLNNSFQKSTLPLEEDIKFSLLFQSVLGHAQNGHHLFKKNNKPVRFPNAMISDVIEAAGLDVRKIKDLRQGLIEDVFECVDKIKLGKTDRLVIRGRPLLGIEYLRNVRVVPEYFLKGIVYAGLMDNKFWRERTENRFSTTINNQPLVIGRGESRLVYKDKLMDWNNFALEYLSTEEITDEILESMAVKGIFAADEDPEAESVYLRRKKGQGTSDDASFIITGEMHRKHGLEASVSAFLGGLVNDGVDTYDKCVSRPINGGYDERLAEEVRENLPNLVTDEEIETLIYYAAKANGPKVPSSSHKRLIQVTDYSSPQQPTYLHHLKFLETRRFSTFKIGFEEMSSKTFYDRINRRIEHYCEHAVG